MRFILVAAAFVASVVSAASLPQVAGVPLTLRQATRKQVVRRASGMGMFRRQSRPSGGVYPTCAGSGPVVPGASANAVYAVIEDVVTIPVSHLLPGETNPLTHAASRNHHDRDARDGDGSGLRPAVYQHA
jgi:hypothetical protein